jgi:hypothetical protein
MKYNKRKKIHAHKKSVTKKIKKVKSKLKTKKSFKKVKPKIVKKIKKKKVISVYKKIKNKKPMVVITKVKVKPISTKTLEKSLKEIKKTRKPRKPSVVKMYFTQDTEDAIIVYNLEKNDDIRNEIYNTKIKAAFEKLVENVFNTFKFSYFETGPIEVQRETVTHLVSNMHKFEKGKGKAFSYFSIIAKNYLIFLNNSNYKRFNQQVEIGEDREEHTVQLQTEDDHTKTTETTEFIKLMVQFWENNVHKIFTKTRDLNIANAVVELFRNSDRVDQFNKKALYLYIREISACKTQQITKVINRMKQYQSNIVKTYLNSGNVNTLGLSKV